MKEPSIIAHLIRNRIKKSLKWYIFPLIYFVVSGIGYAYVYYQNLDTHRAGLILHSLKTIVVIPTILCLCVITTWILTVILFPFFISSLKETHPGFYHNKGVQWFLKTVAAVDRLCSCTQKEIVPKEFRANRDIVKKYLISPFTDPNRKKSSYGDNYLVLDGIRGLAVLIVLASHTGAFGMSGQGSLGVLLFFFLSGFVLMLPFSILPGKIINLSTMSHYFLNRILRIVPLYIIAVLIMCEILHRDYSWYFWNISFIKGWNHLWSVAEEIRFYVLLPVIIFVLSLIKNIYVRVLLLILLIYISFKYQNIHKIDMMDGRHVGFYFYIFLGGCLTCILSRLPLAMKYLNNKYCAKVFSILTILIFLFIFLSSTTMINIVWRPVFPHLPNNYALNGWSIPGTWLILFILFFFGLTFYKGCVMNNILESYLLRHIGLLSYSIYLSHMVILIKLQSSRSKPEVLFITVLTISYLLALLSYITIEKPFLLLKKKSAKSS